MTRPWPRTGFAFGSERERRNADLFYAELMGRSSERPRARQPGRAALESAGEHTPWTPGTEDMAEAADPVIEPGRDDHEIIVTTADGARYRVRRTIRGRVLTRPGRPRVGFCSDDERVFFRLAWCEGSQGTIDAGANPQGAFKTLMDRVVDQIKNGASADQIKETLENAELKAFIDLDIAQVGSWKITGGLEMILNRTGVTSTKATVSGDVGWARLGVSYDRGADGTEVLVTADIPLGKRKIAGKTCPVQEVALWWEAECLREVPDTATIRVPGQLTTEDTALLYFEHASDVLRRDPGVAATAGADEVQEILNSDPKAGTARLNKHQLERLDSLVGRGYWVTAITGFTSPEGRRPAPSPTDTGGAARWEGNEALSRDRAKKVRALLLARYGISLRMRGFREMRFPKGHTMPAVVGASEYPLLNDALGREVEGKRLDRLVLEGPAQDLVTFRTQELERMTDADRAYVTDLSRSRRRRAERLFENLRRVEIRLKRVQKLKDAQVPMFRLERVDPCPEEVIHAAERHWGSRIPFIRADPPLCL